MKKLLSWAGAVALACAPSIALAQAVTLPNVQTPSGHPTPAGASVLVGANGVEKGTTGNPVVTSCPSCSGGGGSSGGTATAANPTYTEGATSQPLSLDLSGRLRILISGSIANTAFASTQSGTWNITNISGTISLPTGAATAANQATLITQTKSLSQAATSTSSNVTAATSSTTLLAANANRLGGAIVNDSTAVLYIKLSATASSTSYDYYLAGSASGVPAQFEIPANWTGAVYGIWASVNGSARVSERTQ
jgi:hypothetical protein